MGGRQQAPRHGRHRVQRPRPPVRRRARRARPLLAAALPVVTAAGLAVAVVLGGGALATTAPPPGPATGTIGAGTPSPVPGWMSAQAAPGPLAGVVPDAGAAADGLRAERERRVERERAERDRAERERGRPAAGVCDLAGPPRFDDPSRPNEITNRDCGYVDDRGRARSHDPWIDDQLRSSYGE